MSDNCARAKSRLRKKSIRQGEESLQGLKPNVTYFVTRIPAMCLIYTSCGLRGTGFWLKKSSIAELPLNLT
jgi:hypothetical protein